MTPQMHTGPDTDALDEALRQDHARLQAALKAEIAASHPDLAQVRALRKGLERVRARLDALHNEPPPHTD